MFFFCFYFVLPNGIDAKTLVPLAQLRAKRHWSSTNVRYLMIFDQLVVVRCKKRFGAEHFPLENVMLNILQSKMWCWTFYKVKCTRCVAKMHLMQKCIFATHQMHFGIKCICNILFCKNGFLHQQNVRIFVFCKAKNTAFCRFLTFWFAEHFPKENVQQNKMYASNTFLHQMHFGKATHRR